MILLNCTDDTQAFTFCESGMKCDMEIAGTFDPDVVLDKTGTFMFYNIYNSFRRCLCTSIFHRYILLLD